MTGCWAVSVPVTALSLVSPGRKVSGGPCADRPVSLTLRTLIQRTPSGWGCGIAWEQWGALPKGLASELLGPDISWSPLTVLSTSLPQSNTEA